jgi:hypothetical protein
MIPGDDEGDPLDAAGGRIAVERKNESVYVSTGRKATRWHGSWPSERRTQECERE